MAWHQQQVESVFIHTSAGETTSQFILDAIRKLPTACWRDIISFYSWRNRWAEALVSLNGDRSFIVTGKSLLHSVPTHHASPQQTGRWSDSWIIMMVLGFFFKSLRSEDALRPPHTLTEFMLSALLFIMTAHSFIKQSLHQTHYRFT